MSASLSPQARPMTVKSQSRNVFERLMPTNRYEYQLSKNKLSDEAPGPGYYDVPTSSFDTCRSHKIQDRKKSEFKSLTSNCDYLSYKECRRQISISGKRETKFFETTDGPARQYEYNPPSTLVSGHVMPKKIKEKKQEDNDSMPGPAYYNVNNANATPAISIIGSKPDNIWSDGISETPGPGAYCSNKTGLPDPPKRWASRLRNTSRLVPVYPLKRNIKTPLKTKRFEDNR